MRVLVIGINYAPDLIGVAKYNTEFCESPPVGVTRFASSPPRPITLTGASHRGIVRDGIAINA